MHVYIEFTVQSAPPGISYQHSERAISPLYRYNIMPQKRAIIDHDPSLHDCHALPMSVVSDLNGQWSS